MLVPGVLETLQKLGSIVGSTGLAAKTIELVHLRVSQINGCSVCLDLHSRQLKRMNESETRMFAVAAWRDAPYFTPEERAALALAEAATRMADRPNPVPDEIWNEAAKYYDEKQLAGLVLAIANINVWNRVNVATGQVAGEWAQSEDAKKWLEREAMAH
ncbi:MAG TPA: carboxymuconolactone decarboxylase family protein [Candidatus Koribacter sp.]|jgi:AhpD family alkylhydroperoxidase